MELELKRQRRNLELIASENIASPAVIAAMGSVLTNKYAEGYPGKRYYGGCEYVDVAGDDRDRARVRAVRRGLCQCAAALRRAGQSRGLCRALQPGDTIMGMDLASGGHLTHGARVNLSGKYYHSISYGVDPETGRIDYDTGRGHGSREPKPKLHCCRCVRISEGHRFQNFCRDCARIRRAISWSIWRTSRVLSRAGSI